MTIKVISAAKKQQTDDNGSSCLTYFLGPSEPPRKPR
jgi:hypothetical protein